MAGEAAAAAGTAAVKKLPKEEEEEDDDELDNVPLALSRAKKAGNASASKVKKVEEEEDDEEDNLPISHSRAKKGNEKQKGTVNSNTKASKIKKQQAESDDDDFTPISQKKNAGSGASNARVSKVKKLKDEDLEDLKEDKKRKKKVGGKEGAKKTVVKGEKGKREKKVYELPGQKHDAPPERDPLRIFYESLYEQVPTSDMAATWLMEWGLLPLDVARKVFEKKQGQKLKSPVKTIVSKRKPNSPAKKTPASSAMKSVSATKPTSQKKRKASSESDDDDDDDFMAPKAKIKRQKASS